MSGEQQEWRDVAGVDDVPENDVIQVRVGEACIALFNVAGRFYATAGICTHAHAFLAQGYMQDDTIECPLHQGVFHIPTGKAMQAPATKNLATYEVRVSDGRLLLKWPGT